MCFGFYCFKVAKVFSAKEWWNFAYNRVQDEAKQRNAKRTWKFALMRARHLNAYCRAYRRKLLAHLEAATVKVVYLFCLVPVLLWPCWVTKLRPREGAHGFKLFKAVEKGVGGSG